MSSKKKLIITLSIVSAVVLAAIIAIVAVFAAMVQNVSSNITIKYVASESVSAEVSATCALGTSDPVSMVDASDAEGKKTVLYFYAGDKSTTKSLVPAGNLEFDEASSAVYVVFEYKFKNTGSSTITAALTIEDVADSELTDKDNSKFEIMVSNSKDGEGNREWTETSIGTQSKTLTVTSNTEATYAVKVLLPEAEQGNSVSFNANFVWALTTPNYVAG